MLPLSLIAIYYFLKILYLNYLYIDWFSLLKNREERKFELVKLNHSQLFAMERPIIHVEPDEINNPFIIKDGVVYLNLDAKQDGKPMACIRHTALRRIEIQSD